MFRHPVLPVSAYLDLYSQGTSGEWTADAGRQDLAIIRSTIGQNNGLSRVLDVGCGDGDFLATLPAKMEKYGIEPSLAAATAARNRGVSILAPTVAQLPPQETFDVITMIDVIEHVAEPGDLLDQVRTHLAPGGCMIVATGDAGNVLWRRVFRSRFWYSSFAEHITFPSLTYLRMWHQGKGLHEPTAVRLKYRQMPSWKVAIYLASQLAYLASPPLLSWTARGIQLLRGAPRPRRRFFSPGAPGLFTDHHIVTIRRLP